MYTFIEKNGKLVMRFFITAVTVYRLIGISQHLSNKYYIAIRKSEQYLPQQIA